MKESIVIEEEVDESAKIISDDTANLKITSDIHYDVASDRKVNFNIAMAQKVVDMPTFVGERKLRPLHVDKLVRAAKSGTFLYHQASISVCECLWDGIERRLNGQHTAKMRTYMPENWECVIQFVRYRAYTDDDFRKLYSNIDRNAPRTNSHVTICRLFGTKEFEGVQQYYVAMLQKGLKLWLFEQTKSTRQATVDDIADLMQGVHLGICLKVGAMMEMLKVGFSRGGSQHLRRASCVAAMFATISKSEKMALEFWTAVSNGLDLESTTDPRYKLREYLSRYSVNVGSGSTSAKAAVTSEDMYRACVSMWNAYRSGESVSVIRIPKKRQAAK